MGNKRTDYLELLVTNHLLNGIAYRLSRQ